MLSKQRLDDFHAGLDCVRVIAIALVTFQHVFTLLEREDLTFIAGQSIGQSGVALFLFVSGLLASESQRPPVQWLLQRLRRLYPAYWLVIAGSFILAWLTGYKSFSIFQFLAQMAGIGLFTHGSALINTPTWFVSLLLLCYLGTFVTRLLRMPFFLSVLASVILAILVGTVSKPWLISHGLTYAVASMLAAVPAKNRCLTSVVLGALLFVLAFAVQPAMGYTALAIFVIELANQVHTTPNWVRFLAKYSYEFYLIHGIVLLGMIRLLPDSAIIAVCVAISLAWVGAIALQRLASKMEQLILQRQKGFQQNRAHAN